MEGHGFVSPEVVARYARDAAQGVEGVTRIVDGVRKGVRLEDDTIELHLAVGWGASIPELGTAVQRAVADYLARMTDVRPAAVNVVVEEVDAA
ncbi:MAG TPA: Asp23/Gls24 family envelope stress response protein [Gaiellaceae bacterium]|nr:Asp23/Gls24 family envelope stress response protein [Gaiellaceae bacterium]